MANTYVDFTGDGNATKAFTFPSFQEADVKVEVDGVLKTQTTHYNITNYTTTGGGNIVFTSGNIPASPAAVRIYRDTDVATGTGEYEPKATYAAGSSVKAGDLNNNQKQALYAIQEEKDQTITTNDIKDGAVTTAKLADGSVTTVKIAADAVTGAKIADDSIDSEHYVDGSIDTAHIGNLQVTGPKIADDTIGAVKLQSNSVTTAKIATDAVTNVEIAGNTILSSNIADNAIITAKIADLNVTTAKIAADAITGAKIADDAIDSEHYTDLSIDTAHIAEYAVSRGKIANDAINGAKIADDAVDSEHYANASIDAAHIANDAIDSQHYAAGSIDNEHMAADSVNTDQYVDGSIGSIHLATGIVTNAKMAANSIDSDQYVNGSIDTAHIADAQVTGTKIAGTTVGASNMASNSVTTAKVTDANITTAKIADSNVTLGKLHGDLKQTTISDSDTQLPTSGAVVDYVAAQIAPIGGLEVIANEDSFPSTQPSSGVVISIADAAGIVVNGSGVSTTARKTGSGSDDVTINGFPSSLYSETLASGNGLMVTSTGSSDTYTYHKLLASESDVKQLSDDINDFNSRYRINAGEPSSNNDDGDLVWDTSADKMKVYDGTASAWKEVTSSGDFKFLVPVDAGTTTAATFDGSDTSFDLKEATNSGSAASVTNINQLMVVLNGVVQKPNAGSWSGSGEGFYLTDSDTIRFATAPPTGSTCFIVQSGSAVTISTPGDGTVSAAKIASGAVETAKIADGAVEHVKLGADCVDGDNIQDDVVNSEHIAAGAVDLEHMSSESVDEDNLYISNAGTNGQFLQKQSGNNGGLTWASVSSTPEGTAILSTGESGGSKFLREDGDGTSSWQSVPAGVGGANGVDFNDSVKTRWGSGNDLEMYHNGTNAQLDNTTGNMELRNVGSFGSERQLQIKAKVDENSILCKSDGGVELYYDNTKKIETTSAGVTVTGDLTVTGTPPVASIGTSGNYTGSHICLGTSAGAYASSNYKICIGYQAGQYGTGRHNNTFIGVNAGRGNSDGTSSTGDSNCCIGDYAGEDLTSGSSNTLIGPNAGRDVTSGNSNVIVGKSAGSTANDIHGTVIIGPSSGYGLDESNYSVIIGHGASGETLQGDAADNQLFIARQGYGGGSSGTWIYGNSDGECQQGGGSSSWSTGSDERYKDFLGKYPRGLAEINGLNVQNFKWKDEKDMPAIAFNNAGTYCGPEINGKTKVGIGAQSCEKLIPEAVKKLEPKPLDKGGNHMLTLDNDPIFWAAINAIQELSTKNDALEARIATLEAK